VALGDRGHGPSSWLPLPRLTCPRSAARKGMIRRKGT
jgi:hypothetical protein